MFNQIWYITSSMHFLWYSSTRFESHLFLISECIAVSYKHLSNREKAIYKRMPAKIVRQPLDSTQDSIGLEVTTEQRSFALPT